MYDIQQRFLNVCKNEIVNFHNETKHDEDKKITTDDVFVVWSCKTLQNSKALLSTTVSDGMYYECTYNGDKKELYFDAYKKVLNKPIDVEL